ncbi:MAG: nucleotide sugar dehydrogenase [Thermoleophilia bacterium]|nr:nucleotide sugar dehydrogenase [Thermoleophilia bacterium]
MISPHYLRLLDLIRDREAIVGIVGQGYVGLPLALAFVESGFRVAGFDLDPKKVAGLNQGESHINHVGADRVAAAVAGGRFVATDDFSRLSECDAVLICVPTPLGKHREPDMRYVRDTAVTIRTYLRPGQLIVLESTTYPGTTDDELQPLLEESGLTTPEDFFLAFSPEREDPGNASFSTKSIPKLVGGVNPESTDVAVALYSVPIAEVVPVSSSRVAEAAKLLENIYRAVNIALVNELKMTFDQMGINVWEVIEAAKTKPFGYQAFYPGPGLGGHCIPLDPFYLSWKAAEYGMWTRFIELAGEINTRMPAYVVHRLAEALAEEKKTLNGAKVLVLGLSYKADIDDDRESPSYEIIELLQERGAEVAYCDPHIASMRPTRRYDLGLQSVPLSAYEFANYDAVVLSTAHQEFKDPALYAGVKLLCDTRNAVTPPEGCRYLRA